MNAITVGQLGCGYWGPNLLRALGSLRGCRVKWLADPSAARRTYVAESFPRVQTDADWRTVVSDPEVDAVVVATPASTHFELAKAALEAGKHVFVEKPLATRLADAEALGAIAEGARRTLMVGHVFLYNAAFRYTKSAIESGAVGDVFYVYTQRLNLGQVRQDVNAWWNFAPHDVSIVVELLGGAAPKTVSARGLDSVQPGIEDVVFATLAWDRVIAQVHVSWLDPGKVRRVTVVGSKKMIVWDDVADDKIAVYDRGVDRVPRLGERMDYDAAGGFQLHHRTGDVLLPHLETKEPLRVELEHFLGCIRTGATPITSARHGALVVRILEAGERSLRKSGALVEVGP